MALMMWLVACNWFTSESDVPVPVVTASVTNRPERPVPVQKPLTGAQVEALDELFVRTTELVRDGEPGAYRSATITFVQTTLDEFHPGQGESVTVVPAAPGLVPQTLRVDEVSEAEVFVQLTTTTTADPAWLTASAAQGARPEVIGRATVLHPVRPDATTGQIPSDLPEGLNAGTVVAGVDLSGDGFADVLTSAHCCDDPALPATDHCDGGSCMVTHVRSAAGWRVAEEG
ncbi:MAG: hypothetical protein AAGA48_01675 [Myxococcota bacterium]